MIKSHEEEHFEVQIQGTPNGTWHTDVAGPRVLYPDLDSAAAWAQKVDAIYHDVRIKHVMADYCDPRLLGKRKP